MASQVILPRLGQGMESGTIVRWLKSEGDTVEKGEPLYELDTDKVTQEVEADGSRRAAEDRRPARARSRSGRRSRSIGEAGEEVVPAMSDEPEPAAEPSPRRSSAARRGPERRPRRAAPASRRGGRERRPGQGVAARPPDRARARDRPRGALRHRARGADRRRGRRARRRLARAGRRLPRRRSRPAEVERVELTSLRKTIARRLTEAWTAPAFQISMSADMTRAQELRAALVERHPDERPTVTDVLTKVCAVALMRHRDGERALRRRRDRAPPVRERRDRRRHRPRPRRAR